MLRDLIAPALRTRGFQGSGQAFSLPSTTHWALLDFQRDKWSNASSLRFTVSVTVVGREAWERAHLAHPWIGTRPSGRVAGYAVSDSELPGYWHARIGPLMPLHADHWWNVIASTDTKKLAAEVVSAIDTHVLPALRDRMT